MMADRSADLTMGESKAQMHLHAEVLIQNGRMFISADAVSSVLGLMEEVTADESVLNLLFPGGHFEVGFPAIAEISYQLEWVGDRLQISGKANFADLQYIVKLEGKVLGQADATVKEGEYIANVLVEGGRGQAGKMELLVLDPATGRELVRTLANNHHR